MELLLVLHGGGFGETGALHVIPYTRFVPIAQRESFVVAYPLGVGGNWNDGRPLHSEEAYRENVDDVRFLRALVDHLAGQFQIDRARVFCTGISNGGFMTNRLVVEAPDLLAAVAPVVAGLCPTLADHFLDSSMPVSAYLIQGEADPVVPFNGGEVGMNNRGPRGETVAFELLVHKYLCRNKIANRAHSHVPHVENSHQDTTVIRSTFPTGISGAKVQVDVVRGGGHCWPGSQAYMSERLVDKTNHAFDASEAIWEFFRRCPSRTQLGEGNAYS